MARGYLQQLSPSTDTAERRSFDRHQTTLNAVLCVRGRYQVVIIEDISQGGMKLKHAFDLVVGDLLTIELLSHRTFEGSVAWVTDIYAGITFRQPLAEDDPLLAV